MSKGTLSNAIKTVQDAFLVMLIEFKKQIRRQLAILAKRYILPIAAYAGRPNAPIADRDVNVLVSSKTAEMCILAVQSLECCTGIRWMVYIHDDGTVSALQRAFIEKRLPGIRFVSRKEGDRLAAEKLSESPFCRRLRASHNYLLKITDTLFFSEGRPFLVLDADVFFYRKSKELIQWAMTPNMFLFMTDTKEAYCHPRDVLATRTDTVPAVKLNAGLCAVPSGIMDLAFCERMLEKLDEGCEHPMFHDQTLLALAGGRSRAIALPASYEITWNLLRSRGAVCRHYVGPAKEDLLFIEGPASLVWRMAFPVLLRALRIIS